MAADYAGQTRNPSTAAVFRRAGEPNDRRVASRPRLLEISVEETAGVRNAMKSISNVGLVEVKAIYNSPEGDLW